MNVKVIRCDECDRRIVATGKRMAGRLETYHIMTEHPTHFHEEIEPMMEKVLEHGSDLGPVIESAKEANENAEL